MNAYVADGRLTYCKWQREMCPETGREHQQMWLLMSSPVRIGGITAMMPGCHADIQQGTDLQADAYVSKADSRVSGPFTVHSQNNFYKLYLQIKC